ncbi:MAG: hypothetical protein FD167_1645 [bacterium]|nr:MAG: hypothetical protein FD167_1645 [bacterium]
MDIVELAASFFRAKEKFDQVSIKILESHTDNWQDYLAARDEYALAKQELAIAKGEEYVVNYDLGCIPDISDSKEIVLQISQTTFLMFKALSPIISTTGNYLELGIAILNCQGCLITKFGYPNEENLSTHPLFPKGLDECLGVGEVVNSLWKTAIMEKYSIMSNTRTKPTDNTLANNTFNNYKHFIFVLKDNTFECVAKNLLVIFSQKSYLDIITEITNKSI